MEELSNSNNYLIVEWSPGGDIVPEIVETEVIHLSAREVMKTDTLCNGSEVQSECFHKAPGKGRLCRGGKILNMAKPLFFYSTNEVVSP